MMNKWKNKNTINPTNGSFSPTDNFSSKENKVTRDRDNAIENIKTTHPTKK